LIEQGVTSG